MSSGDLNETLRLVQGIIFAVNARGEFAARSREGTWGSFLEHAIRTVPIYSRLPIGDQTDFWLGRLKEFPFVTRGEITKNLGHFHSDQFDPDDCFEATTSGTTGVPLSVVRDRASYYGFTYGTYEDFFHTIPGLREEIRPGKCAVLIVNDNPKIDENLLIHPGLQYARIRRIVLRQNIEEDRSAIIRAMRESPLVVTGRPRAIDYMIHLVDGQRIPRPTAIITSGDNLHEDVRYRIESVLRSKVYNAYASQEAGMIAMECEYQMGLHIREDTAICEIFDIQLKQSNFTGCGELVITSNQNWAMPFIRYRTGDSATVETVQCKCGRKGHVLSQLHGRDSVYFWVGGTRINPSIFNGIFEALAIRQFQVCQVARNKLMVWLVRSHENAEMQRQKICKIRIDMKTLVPDASIDVEWCDEISSPEKKVQRYVCVSAD